MHNPQKLTIAALASILLLLDCGLLSAQSIDPFAPPFARDLAIGGPHAAIADDYSVILTNPAGLAYVKNELFVAQISPIATGPIFDIANIFTGGTANIPLALQTLLANNNFKLYAGMELLGPFSFGLVDKGLGFGVFNRTRFVFNAASASNIRIRVAEDILITGGYAFKFDLGMEHSISLGAGIKGFFRGDIDTTVGLLELASLLTNPMAIIAKPFSLTTGVGIDLGLRWSWLNQLSAGLVWRDAYSPAFTTTYSDILAFFGGSTPSAAPASTIASNLDLGMAWTPQLGSFSAIIDAVTIALDYSDILDLFAPLPRNAILHLSAGAEVTVLDIVQLRLGIREALLSAGVGLNLQVFRLSLSAYGSELGLDPGVRPVYNLMIGIEFRY